MKIRKYVSRILFEINYKFIVRCIKKSIKDSAYPYLLLVLYNKRRLYRVFLQDGMGAMRQEALHILDEYILKTSIILDKLNELDVEQEESDEGDVYEMEHAVIAEYGKSIDEIMEEVYGNNNK